MINAIIYFMHCWNISARQSFHAFVKIFENLQYSNIVNEVSPEHLHSVSNITYSRNKIFITMHFWEILKLWTHTGSCKNVCKNEVERPQIFADVLLNTIHWLYQPQA